MDTLSRDIAQGGVYQALALQARYAGERITDDLDGEVRFAAAIVARMAMMSCAVVDDSKVGGGKGFAEKPSHFLSNRSGHDFQLEHLRPI